MEFTKEQLIERINEALPCFRHCITPDNELQTLKKTIAIYEIALAALNAPLVNEWIACADKMPEDDTVVLVCQEDGITFCAEVSGGEFYPDEFPNVPARGREITHWMPMPETPRNGKENAQ
ncbi:DUF551 domain-containing protein [Escherichia coli]|uniref:DUF551 domain-containing protein n=1 Tax=Escherichia coli TaxID=562 RepID=A0A7U5TH20_ECOLX|nr:DUF551 domain-containing protein [Escherichia coli]AUY01031.1 hypothetical protein C3F40_03880 [Escherichia coli]